MSDASRKGLLRHAADRRSLAFAAAHFALVGTVFALAPRGPWLVLSTSLIAYSAFIHLISGHNAMHAPVFYRRGFNRAWQLALSMTFSYPVSAFVPVHNLSHHMHLQTPKDVLRTTEMRHRSNLLNLLHHAFAAALHAHILNAVYAVEMRKRRPVWFAQMRNEIFAVLLFDVTLLVISPSRFLVYVFLPYLVGQFMIFGFGYVQHDACDAGSEYNHSRNFVGRFFNWFIFDNGFHTIHHVRAGLHWSLGRAAHEQQIAPHMDPALDERSCLAYMWRAYVWPGKRLRYDGAVVEFSSPPTRRELWVPPSAQGEGAATGAVAG